MKNSNQTVMVVGGGPAGLSAARDLARSGVSVVLLEQSGDLGGHARRFTCKASPECVACGACMVPEQVRQVKSDPGIDILTHCEIRQVTRSSRFSVEFTRNGNAEIRDVEAVVLATGFQPFDPSEKPYGYGQFPDVLTNLELEDMMRKSGKVSRPSDSSIPGTLAFIQCVGSRDITLNHLWCSRVCCASALRMARRIRHHQPEIDVAFFYIDVQTFGKNFHRIYPALQPQLTQIRAIPGDVVQTPEGRLRIGFFHPMERKYAEISADMVVLSIGMTPSKTHAWLADRFGAARNPAGFFSVATDPDQNPGVFPAGSALGPMGIAESIADGSRAAERVLVWLDSGFKLS